MSTASSRSARTIDISSIISRSNVLMIFTLSLRRLLYFSGIWYSVTSSLTSGRYGHRGSWKNEWIVDPPAFIAATPVGASTTNLFEVSDVMYFRKVVLPVPALPVRKTDRPVPRTYLSAVSKTESFSMAYNVTDNSCVAILCRPSSIFFT